MFVSNTNLECEIKQDDYKKTEELLFSFGCSPYEIEHIKTNNLDNIISSDIKLKNGFLSNDEIGYTINFIDHSKINNK